jgi:hypothetical protein
MLNDQQKNNNDKTTYVGVIHLNVELKEGMMDEEEQEGKEVHRIPLLRVPNQPKIAILYQSKCMN